MDYLRIDDRLIHGQIVTAWCGHLKINEIIAIDDALKRDLRALHPAQAEYPAVGNIFGL